MSPDRPVYAAAAGTAPGRTEEIPGVRSAAGCLGTVGLYYRKKNIFAVGFPCYACGADPPAGNGAAGREAGAVLHGKESGPAGKGSLLA